MGQPSYCTDCAQETAALAAAEGNFQAAEDALIVAENNFFNDPNPTTAAALAAAEGNYNANVAALSQAEHDYYECLYGNSVSILEK